MKSKTIDNLKALFQAAKNVYGSRVVFDVEKFDYEPLLARRLAKVFLAQGDGMCMYCGAGLVMCFGLTVEEASPFYVFCADKFDGMYYPILGESELTGVN